MNIWLVIGLVAVVNIVIKAAGPAVLKDSEFSPRMIAVIDALAPALLAGLVIVDLIGPGWKDADWTVLPGLGLATVLWRLKVPDIACVLAAVAITAGLRAVIV